MAEEFVNVYNFIAFPDKKECDYEENGHITGVMTYKITTKTPLFIPNTSSEHAFRTAEGTDPEHKSYDFYSYREMKEGETYDASPACPVIPGSEIRGMVRGIYETLTDSCMGILNEEEIPVKRTSEMFRAGLLKRTGIGCLLVEAEDCIYREKEDKGYLTYKETCFEEGQKLYFEKSKRIKGKPLICHCSIRKDPPHPLCGDLIKGMSDKDIGKKRNAHIFILKASGGMAIKLQQEALKQLEAVLDSYRKEPKQENWYLEYREKLKEFQAGKGEEYFPVYYSQIKQSKELTLLYLAPACYTKELAHHSIGELASVFAPCKDNDVLCPACALFGRTGASNETSRTSKLRFTDAYPEAEKSAGAYYDEPVTLQILGSPKISNADFYLYRPEGADFWTYDYYTKDGKLYIQPGKLRGRKYYWHQPDVRLPKDIQKDKLNKTIRPVRENEVFIGKIYFDGISEKQLAQLQWVMNCGEDGSDLAYKLGGGKPLGLGSIECRVIDVKKRQMTLGEQGIIYEEIPLPLEIKTYDALKFSSSCKAEFETMCTYHNEKHNISYPVTEEQSGKPVTECFHWFEMNHRNYKLDDSRTKKLDLANETGMATSRLQMKTLQALPLATEVAGLVCGKYKTSVNSSKSKKSSNRMRHPSDGTPAQGGRKPEKGEQFTAKVTGYREAHDMIMYLRIQIDGGKSATLRCKEIMGRQMPDEVIKARFPIGTELKVAYMGASQGKDGRFYDNYKYIN